MRRSFFIDENLSPVLQKPLQGLFHHHRFTTAQRENLVEVDDVDLIRDLASRHFDCIITLDRQQLHNPMERAALLSAKLHWVGLPQPGGGLSAVTELMAAATFGVAHALRDWPPQPTAFHLANWRTPGSRTEAL